MAIKDYVYTTDKNRKYLVRLDEALGKIASLGFRLVTEGDKDLDYLPRYLKMRTYFCGPNKTSVFKGDRSRTFAIGSPTANILASPEAISYKGLSYVPRRYHPEQARKPQTRSE